MNSASTLRVLVVSDLQDVRAALRWSLGHAFAAPEVLEAESVEAASGLAESESPGCVVADAALPGFAEAFPGFAEGLWKKRIALITLHDGLDAAQKGQELPEGIAACLAKASLSVRTLELSVRKALDLSKLTRLIDEQQRELGALRTDFESVQKKLAESEATESVSASVVQDQLASQPVCEHVAASDESESAHEERTASANPERPQFVTSSLNGVTDHERELAGQIQKELMPPGSPLVEGLEIAGLSIPAETTGGDYYDYLPMANHQLCVSIGECSGRGIAPAMMMASLRAYLRVLAAQSADISDIISQANTFITEDIGDEEFIITLMLFQIDARTRDVRYVSAGHQAFLIHDSGQSEVLHSTGMPLGLQHETVIPEGESFKLAKGDILLLASDGVQKMESESGEQFGTARMVKLVQEQSSLPTRVLANSLRKACTDFAADHGQSDDVTIIVIKGEEVLY